MSTSYFFEQTPYERERREYRDQCGHEPTPLMPLTICILVVSMAAALVEVNWASPLLGGMVLLVMVAAIGNMVEKAQENAFEKTRMSRELLREQRGCEGERRKRQSQNQARASDCFRSDHLWGLN